VLTRLVGNGFSCMDKAGGEIMVAALKKTPRYAWVMLILVILAKFSTDGFMCAGTSPLLPFAAKEMHLSQSQVGFIWGAIPFGMLITAVLGGILADRFGVKRVLSIAIIFATVTGGTRFFAHSYSIFWLTMFLMGLGMGATIPNLTKVVGIWFEGTRRLAQANGILIAGYFVGAGLAMALSAGVLVPLVGGWRQTFLLYAGTGIALWVPWLLAARERKSAGSYAQLLEAQPSFWEALRHVFSIRQLWFLCIVELFVIGGEIAFHGMMPDILVRDVGMTPGTAGLFTSMASWAAVPGVIAGSWLSDRLGLRRKIVLSALFANVGFLLAIGLLLHTFIPLFIVIILSGFSIGIFIPLIRTIVVELKGIGPILAGSAYGAIFTFNRLGGFVIPWLMGIVLDMTHQAFLGFAFLAGVALLGALLFIPVKETGPQKNLSEAKAFLGGGPGR